MIIYYHCNSDNALLLSFFHPYIDPVSFHFILVPPVFCIRRAALASLVMRIRNKNDHAFKTNTQMRIVTILIM